MAKLLRFSVLALAVAAFAGVALAQSADKNTGGLTANTLQLRLTEPAEGATITGTQVRVGVAYNMTGPQPTFDIFLGNDLKATLKGTEANVAFIENVPPGNHKIVVMAKNVSGEVIDRKEVGIIVVPAAMAETTTTTFVERTEPAPPPPAAEPVIEAPPPPPAPVEVELPKTATAYPQMAAAGLALALVGLTLARKAR